MKYKFIVKKTSKCGCALASCNLVRSSYLEEGGQYSNSPFNAQRFDDKKQAVVAIRCITEMLPAEELFIIETIYFS